MMKPLAARADGAPTLSLCLIAKNEAEILPQLLTSVEGAFDEVILVDTGSTDDTMARFRRWAGEETRRAAERGETFSHLLSVFEWRDDFAAARTYADSLARGDWLAWADADDVLHGAENLRMLAAQTPAEVVALVARYDYAQDAHGNCVCTLKRERLVRRGCGRWEGRVHEAQAFDGGVQMIPPEIAEWRHRKPAEDGATSNERNLRILRQWVKDEPAGTRQLMYLGTEELTRGRAKPAIRWFKRYLRQDPGWTEERAQVHRKLALCYIATGQPGKAADTALEALRLMPTWPDSALSLAEAHYELREPEKAMHWAGEALKAGEPDSMLILNPADYTVLPLVVLAGACSALGRIDEAIQYAEQALALQPDHPALAGPYRAWLVQRKRDHTADTFLAAADVLVAHDEQLKARAVLESVPHYCADHPRVVAARSQLRERLDPLFDTAGYTERYTTGGSKPEDLVADDRVMPLGDALPRCGFLLRGLTELAAA